YVHRVGRTARADSSGVAITFVNDKDKFKYSNIEKLIGMEIEKVAIPEHLGEAPSFSSDTANGSKYPPHPKNKKQASKSGAKNRPDKVQAAASGSDSSPDKAAKKPKQRPQRRNVSKTTKDESNHVAE